MSAPDWLDEEKFDIGATFPPGTARERIHEMTRTLLADRFGLKVHYEIKSFVAYALVVGKRGPKLQVGRAGEDGAFIWSEGKLTARSISMSGLADRLSEPVFKLDRPLVDVTGLKGSYDFALKWSPEDASASANSSGSIYAALQEQLGLRLEARRIAARILVVDRMQKIPSGN